MSGLLWSSVVRGDQHFPLRYETFGKPIDGCMNKKRPITDCSCDATRIYYPIWNKSFSVGKAPYAGIDAVFWWIWALRKISARLSGYGSITFRRENNRIIKW
jgi:hypothetical protein